ncbi:MAG: c-type cytochrome, partial [Bacteroidia bacterium]
GKLDYIFPYDNSDAGRAQASDELSNPIELDNYSIAEGKRLYNLYCDHCHGEKGDGNGSLVEAGKIPSMGEYYGKLADRTEGSIFHTITLGKGIMGSHASQLSPDQRWLITGFVQIMQKGAEAYNTNNIADYHALMMNEEAASDDVSAESEEMDTDNEIDVLETEVSAEIVPTDENPNMEMTETTDNNDH